MLGGEGDLFNMSVKEKNWVVHRISTRMLDRFDLLKKKPIVHSILWNLSPRDWKLQDEVVDDGSHTACIMYCVLTWDCANAL